MDMHGIYDRNRVGAVMRSAGSIAAELQQLDEQARQLGAKVKERGSLGLGQLQDFARRRCWTPEMLASALTRAAELGVMERYRNFQGQTRYRLVRAKNGAAK